MLCNTAFSTRGGLTRHTVKEHKGHKIFMCDTCGKIFGSLINKTIHIEKEHVLYEKLEKNDIRKYLKTIRPF